MTDEWKKTTIIESGNYPKNSFKGVLKAIYPTYNEKLEGYVLQLDFETGQTYSMPLNAKDYGLHEDGSVDGFLAIGQFLASIERIDVATGLPNTNNNDAKIKRIETFWAWLDGSPAGFKTEPDIVGCTLSNIATKRQIGDDQQTSKYPDWTIGQVEGLQAKPAKPATPAKKPAGRPPAAPKASVAPVNDALVTQIEDKILEGVPATIGALYDSFGGPGKSPYKPDQIRTALAALQTKE